MQVGAPGARLKYRQSKAARAAYLSAARAPPMPRLALFLLAAVRCALACHAFVLAGPRIAQPARFLRSAPVALRATGEQVFAAHCPTRLAGGLHAAVAELRPDTTALDKYLLGDVGDFGDFPKQAVAPHPQKRQTLHALAAVRLCEAEAALVAVYVLRAAARRGD